MAKPTIEQRLTKAKTALIIDHPFIGSLVLNMPMKADQSVQTAATDGKAILYNPDYLGPMTDNELVFVVAHEVFHGMLFHNHRRGDRNPTKWNYAVDYVVNYLLVDEKIGSFRYNEWLYDREIYHNGNGQAEQIYDLLPDMPDDGGKGSGSGQGPLDECNDAGSTPAEIAEQEAQWSVKVAQAAQAAKMTGALSAGMERLVKEILHPKVHWADVWRDFMEKAKTDQRSWARPNRRFLSQGMYLPSSSGEALGEVVVAIDCSGSISEREISQFAAEVNATKEDCRPRMLHVVYFDSSVSHHDTFEDDDELHVEPHGGGGTAFSPIFEFIDEQGIDPAACAVLTDLYCSDFGDDPGYPVLWVSTSSKDSAPFGQVVSMR